MFILNKIHISLYELCLMIFRDISIIFYINDSLSLQYTV